MEVFGGREEDGGRLVFCEKFAAGMWRVLRRGREARKKRCKRFLERCRAGRVGRGGCILAARGVVLVNRRWSRKSRV